jgi:hypothetical protein
LLDLYNSGAVHERDPQDPEGSPEWRRIVELEELIAGTPAATRAGLEAQVAVARDYVDAEADNTVDVALRNVMAALERSLVEAPPDA